MAVLHQIPSENCYWICQRRVPGNADELDVRVSPNAAPHSDGSTEAAAASSDDRTRLQEDQKSDNRPSTGQKRTSWWCLPRP